MPNPFLFEFARSISAARVVPSGRRSRRVNRRNKSQGIVELTAMLAQQAAFSGLPLDHDQAKEFVVLSSVRDPFDRMVIAAARAAKVPTITADESITSGGLVQTLWN